MKATNFFLLSAMIALASCHPLSFQKVQFVVGGDNSDTKPKTAKNKALNRNSRSFSHWFSSSAGDVWPSVGDVFHPPSITIYDLSLERGHISPDYSNGLDYPDPLLLRGKDALIAVKYLYGRGELFYHQIPHIRALLRNQEERRRNGLDGNYLSSNRPGSPFYRH